jgi:hypothetical protein
VGSLPWWEGLSVIYSHNSLSFSGQSPSELLTKSYWLIWTTRFPDLRRASYWSLLNWVDTMIDGQSAYPSSCRAPISVPLADFSFSGQLFCSSSWGALSDERTGLQFVVQSARGYSHGGLITIYYCLVWDYCVPFPSPLTTRREYGGILTRLQSSSRSRSRSYFTTDGQSVRQSVTMSWCRVPFWGPWPDFTFFLSFVGKLHCSSSWGSLSNEWTDG